MNKKIWILFAIISIIIISLVSYNLTNKENSGQRAILVGKVVFTNSNDYNIVIDNSKFSPKEMIVSVGSEITWTNRDTTEHLIKSNDGIFESPSLSIGKKFSHTFNDPGEYEYYCAINPSISGKIIVGRI